MTYLGAPETTRWGGTAVRVVSGVVRPVSHEGRFTRVAAEWAVLVGLPGVDGGDVAVEVGELPEVGRC